MNRIALTACFVFLLSGPAIAQQPQAGLTISNAWSRATPSAHGNGVIYLTVTDTGEPDTLVSTSTPVAAKAQLHESKIDNGVMQMTPVASLAVDKDHPITLAPGGYHLMLEDMKQRLKAGDTFPLTLTFAHAGAIQSKVTVRSMQAISGGDTMPGMDMGGMQINGTHNGSMNEMGH